VYEGGRIVERGTHASLLAAGGLYARLYREQFEVTDGDGRAAPSGGPAAVKPVQPAAGAA
jgi:ATP-binding cassette subfamily B protein